MKFSDMSNLVKVAGLGLIVLFLMLVLTDNEGTGTELSTDNANVVAVAQESGIVQGDYALITEETVGGKTLDDLTKRVTDLAPPPRGLAAMDTTAKTLHQGTRVMVVETDRGAARVRVVDGPGSGSECWVEKTRLKKI